MPEEESVAYGSSVYCGIFVISFAMKSLVIVCVNTESFKSYVINFIYTYRRL
jgi:hypothetical protein